MMEINVMNKTSCNDNWIMKNFSIRTGSEKEAVEAEVIQEIKENNIENQTIIVTSSSSLAELSGVRKIKIESLTVNDIYLLQDIFYIYSHYKYLIFDSLHVEETEMIKTFKTIFSFADQNRQVNFKWIGDNSVIDQVYKEEYKKNNEK